MVKSAWQIVSSKYDIEDYSYYLKEYVEEWREMYQGNPDYLYKTTRLIDNTTVSCDLKSLRVPKKVSQAWASLLFDEEVNIEISDETTHNYVMSILDKENFFEEFPKELEQAFALGSRYQIVYTKSNDICIDYVDVSNIIPITYKNGRLYEMAEVEKHEIGENYITVIRYHLNQNGNYIIINECYLSDNENDIGIFYDGAYELLGIEQEIIYPMTKPTFQVIEPNIANNIDAYCPFGISIFANSIDIIKAIDEKYTDFVSEYDLSKRRIIVSSDVIQKQLDASTGQFVSYFDKNDRVYQGVSSGIGEQPITSIDFSIRDQSYINGLNQDFQFLADSVGFDAGTFIYNGQSMKTATEVISERSKTFKNKKIHEISLRRNIEDLVESIVKLARFKGVNLPDYEISVTFNDNIVVDDDKRREEERKDVVAGTMPKLIYLMRNYGLTESDALAWIDMIKSEQPQGVDMSSLESLFTGGGASV